MKTLAVVWLAAFACVSASAASGRAELGTSAVVDADGRLWIAYTQSEGPNAHVVLRRSDDVGATWKSPMRVTAKAEPIAADGENRPKLVFGPGGEMYVSWTSPTTPRSPRRGTTPAYTGDVHFSRSLDGGAHWSAPMAVHRDRQLITHKFESMIVDGAGRIWITWIDKRDLKQAEAQKRDYAGAAIYYAYSQDKGASWHGDFKLADHTCECCRIALTKDPNGRAAVLWRHVFPPNERDHAYTLLDPKGDEPSITRVTFDRWRIDACPHHGPSLAFAPDGARHAVWFNQSEGEGRVFYGRLGEAEPTNVKVLPAGASHADVAATSSLVAVAWKRFDGKATRVESWVSTDGGRNFSTGPVLQTSSDSDQPRVISTKNDDAAKSPSGDILLVWRRAEGVAVRSLGGRASAVSAAPADAAKTHPAVATPLKPFERNTLASIERRYRGRPFWLVMWDLECAYCMKSLRNLVEAQRAQPGLNVVTITTDSMAAVEEIDARLAQLGIQSDAYAFSGSPSEALRFAIDPTWMGEKPRAYRYDADGKRQAISGVIAVEQFARQ